MTIKVKRFKRKKRINIKIFFLVLTSLISLSFLVLMVMPEPSYKECFKNLADMQRYANISNENTPMENSDTLRPEFTKHYQSLVPSFFQKIKNKIIWLLSKINVVQAPAWDVSAFKAILEDLGSTQQKAGMKDSFVYRIQTQPNSKIVIFGNLQGSFHSFIRCLTKIKELGIIDDSLKITQSQNYIFLMGDVVDRSPFTLETLTAAMRLMQVNPNNFIYLRGNHESNNYWQEHTLKIELQIRARHLSKGAVPFEAEINTFFNSLPLAAYLTVPNTINDFVRLSDAGRQDSTILNESNFADILTKKTDTGSTYFAIKENMEASSTRINIKAIVRGEKKRKTFQKNEGLRFLAPDLDSVAWNVLSCPNIVYQKALEFYFDAFAIITTTEKLNDWEITLFNRDIRTKDPFKELKHNFISGLDVEAHKKMESTPIQQNVQQQAVPQTQPTPTAAQSQNQPQQTPQTTAPQPQQPLKEPQQPIAPQQIQSPPQVQTQQPIQQQTQPAPAQQPVAPQQIQTQAQVSQQTSPPVQQQGQSPTGQQAQPLLQVIPETEQKNLRTQQSTQQNQVPSQPVTASGTTP